MGQLLDPTVLITLSVVLYGAAWIHQGLRTSAIALAVFADLLLCLTIRTYSSQIGAASVALPVIFLVAVLLVPLAARLLDRVPGVPVSAAVTDALRLSAAALLGLTFVLTRHPFVLFFLCAVYFLLLTVTDAGPARQAFTLLWLAVMFAVLFHFAAGSFVQARSLPSSWSFRAWMALVWVLPSGAAVFERRFTMREKGLVLLPISVLAISQLRIL